ALGPAALRAARAATTSISIVASDLESNPLRTGFIAANRRPGSNVTGVFLDFPDFSKKWLQAVKEAVPQTSTVAVLWEPATGSAQRSALEAAAIDLNLTLVVLEIRVTDDLERALRSAKDQRASGLVVLSSPLIGGQTKLLAELAMKYRFPAITLFAEFARDGGLMAYGPGLLSVLLHNDHLTVKA